jgi:uncharacterized membrane protein
LSVLLKVLNFLGGGLCHQRDPRSFGFDGLYMPLCSRCTGIYIGLLFSLVAIVLIERRVKGKFPSVKTVVFAVCAILLMGLDAVVSALKFFDSNNYIRFTTGFLAGWFIALILIQLKNILMWKKLVRVPYLNDKKHFIIWILCGIGLIAAFMFSFERLLVFWGVISVIGVIIFVTLILLILFFGTIRGMTNKINSWKSYILFFTAGIFFSIGILSLLSTLRQFLI